MPCRPTATPRTAGSSTPFSTSGTVRECSRSRRHTPLSRTLPSSLPSHRCRRGRADLLSLRALGRRRGGPGREPLLGCAPEQNLARWRPPTHVYPPIAQRRPHCVRMRLPRLPCLARVRGGHRGPAPPCRQGRAGAGARRCGPCACCCSRPSCSLRCCRSCRRARGSRGRTRRRCSGSRWRSGGGQGAAPGRRSGPG